MAPAVIAPRPRTGTECLNRPHEVLKIVHPELSEPDRDIIRAAAPVLMLGRLLVAPDVDELRVAEDLVRVAQHVLADLVVGGRGQHAAVVLQPPVMRGGEVQLRDRLKAHAPQPGELGAEFVHAPGAGDGQLGVAGVDDALPEVDHDHVHLFRGRMIRDLAPQVVLAAERRVRQPRRELGQVDVRREPIAPHVVAEVQQHRLDGLGTLGGHKSGVGSPRNTTQTERCG